MKPEVNHKMKTESDHHTPHKDVMKSRVNHTAELEFNMLFHRDKKGCVANSASCNCKRIQRRC